MSDPPKETYSEPPWADPEPLDVVIRIMPVGPELEQALAAAEAWYKRQSPAKQAAFDALCAAHERLFLYGEGE